MGVDDDHEVFVESPVHHLFYSCEPNRVDGHGVDVGMWHPPDRYSDGVEPFCLHLFQHFLCGFRVSPSRFPFVVVLLPNVFPCILFVVPASAGTFECVAKVPSHGYLATPLLCVDVVVHGAGCCCNNHCDQ